MIAEQFEPLDIECLVTTAVELWEGIEITNLSERQRDTLNRARDVMLAEHAGQPLPDPQRRASIFPVRRGEARPVLAIRSFLDLSTAHLRAETRANLSSYHGVLAHKTMYGWLVYASEETDLCEEGGWPAELIPLVKLARTNGCEYILFDVHAPETDGLPAFGEE